MSNSIGNNGPIQPATVFNHDDQPAQPAEQVTEQPARKAATTSAKTDPNTLDKALALGRITGLSHQPGGAASGNVGAATTPGNDASQAEKTTAEKVGWDLGQAQGG